MLRWMFAAVAACGLCLTAGSVAAEPYQSFLDMCVRGNGDAQAAGAAARGAGWTMAPKSVLEGSFEDFRDTAAFLNFDPKAPVVPDNAEMLMTGWGAGQDLLEIEGVRVDLCLVASQGLDAEATERRFDDLLGFGSTEVTGERAWIFSRKGDSFQSEHAILDRADDMLATLSERKLYVITIIHRSGSVSLAFGALRVE